MVVTGWLGTALLAAITAALAGAAAALTGSFSADAKDGVRPAGAAAVAGLDQPAENVPGEYVAAGPGWADIR